MPAWVRPTAHEGREVHDIARRNPTAGCHWFRADEIGRVLRQGVELAIRGVVPLVGEVLVGDALLDVVGLAGEHQQRLVLRLPAEAGDRAVVTAAVEDAGSWQ